MTRLARSAARRPRRTLAAAAALLALAAVLGVPVTGMLGSDSNEFQAPGSQYERANAAIRAATGQSPFFGVAALLRGRDRLASEPATRSPASALARMLRTQRGFERVLDYGGAGTDSRSRALLSRDGRETLVLAAFATIAEANNAISRVRAALANPRQRARLAGATVRFGGVALVNKELDERTTSDLERAEPLALPILLALSFWFFRGLVAALLPPLVGGLAILLTFLGLRVVNQITPVSIFSLNLVSGMGLGLGIDYSLFVLYRYREELARGAHVRAAIERTLRTAGRTVL